MAGIRDEVALQYYRLDRVHTGAIGVAEGELQYVKPPTETGTRKAQDDQAPLSEIIETLNERFGTQFTEEDRLFFDQIKERACNSDAVVRTALANTLDRINSTGPMGKLPLLLSYIKSFPSDMQQSVPRSNLLAAVTEGISETPVVALLGARQVGKTTLAGQVASAWPGPSTVFDLELATTRAALSETPERLLRRSEGLMVIDEVQRMPGLFEVLRPICDDRNRNAIFLLLGSASRDLIRACPRRWRGAS